LTGPAIGGAASMARPRAHVVAHRTKRGSRLSAAFFVCQFVCACACVCGPCSEWWCEILISWVLPTPPAAVRGGGGSNSHDWVGALALASFPSFCSNQTNPPRQAGFVPVRDKPRGAKKGIITNTRSVDLTSDGDGARVVCSIDLLPARSEP
jgi:hypothetical protein